MSGEIGKRFTENFWHYVGLTRPRKSGTQSTRLNRMHCSLEPVTVAGPMWCDFLTWSVEYIATYWPESIPAGNSEAFLADYEKELKLRVAQGGRGLFFLIQNRARVGIANVYISREQSPYLGTPAIALYVAELHIIEQRQRKGLGKCFLYLLIQWGLDQGAEALVVEVDKDLQPANLFWSSLGMRLLSDRKRNIYLSSNLRVRKDGEPA
jgi:GNAT superfamily N-acetyltransferase